MRSLALLAYLIGERLQNSIDMSMEDAKLGADFVPDGGVHSLTEVGSELAQVERNVIHSGSQLGPSVIEPRGVPW